MEKLADGRTYEQLAAARRENARVCMCGHALLFHDTRGDEPCNDCECEHFEERRS